MHLHSTASDGLRTPPEVVRDAAGAGLGALALTDHDTTAGVVEARWAATEFGLCLIPGVELSTISADRELHILGYGYDIHNPRLQFELQLFRRSREERLAAMVRKLVRLGLNISYDRVRQLAGDGAMARPHLARAMVEAGYVPTMSMAFDMYIGRGKAAYVERYMLSPRQAVELIRSAGGMAVLAHPGSAGRDEDIPPLVEAGLEGVEVYHPDHDRRQVERYLELAERLQLLVTGGSDSHGDVTLRSTTSGQCGLDRRRFEMLAHRLGITI